MSAQLERERSVIHDDRGAAARRVGLIAGVACAGALSLALGGAKDPLAAKASPRARQPVPAAAAGQAQPQPQADQVGDIVSSYVCVRVQPGVSVTRRADGTWMLRRAAALPEGGPGGGAGGEQDELALRNVLAQHQVTEIRPFFNHQFKRADLAAKYGLDRAWTVYVAPGGGADVVALNAAFANFAGLIERSELDSVGSLAGIPNDTSFANQWDMHNTGQGGGAPDADIDAPEAWELHTGAASTIIAVCDTGVQADHPDLSGKVISGWNTRDETADTSDPHGHGTHCSGIAAAQGNNGVGVAGTNWNARILAIRVTSATGGANQLDVAEGVMYAADHDADVISMSLQFLPPTSSPNLNLENACAYAYDSGVLPVAASGNAGMATVAWPARYPKCMAVGATTNTDTRWTSSSYGPEMDVVAPGVGIYNLWRLSGYNTQNGTSMATPHVAGLAALLMSYNPSLTVPEIENIIRNTAQDVNSATNPGFDNFLGFGRINLHTALQAAANDCPANIITSGGSANSVDIDDLLAVISAWGPCPAPPTACPANINNSGGSANVVNIDDLLGVISAWGACP